MRQQLRSQLGQGIRDTEQVLSQYRAAYPSFDLVDWPAVQQHLAGQPVPGVNVHPEVEGPRSPAWIQEQTIEPIEFGSLADPVSQAAFLLAPGLLKGVKTGLEVAGGPGPRLGGFIGERGNLGPVPRSQSGQALPESAVRTETGELKRLYHGTDKVYPDFAAAKFGSGAGGDLYGPGIYMTDSPVVAGGTGQGVGRLGYAQTIRPDLMQAQSRLPKLQQDIAMLDNADTAPFVVHEYAGTVPSMRQGAVPQPGNLWGNLTADLPPVDAGQIQALRQRLVREQGALEEQIWQAGSQPNVRPVYADLQKPFDIEARVGYDAYQALGAPSGYGPNSSGKQLYENLVSEVGSKAAANQRLAELGYDGITHIGGAVTGGQPHRVYIAFSPEQVYPSVNVEGGLPIPPQP